MGAQSLWYRRRSLPPQKPYSSSWPMHTRICWSGFNDPSGVDLPGRTPDCSQDRRHRPGTRRNAAAARCGRRLAPMTWQHRARLNFGPGGTTRVASWALLLEPHRRRTRKVVDQAAARTQFEAVGLWACPNPGVLSPPDMFLAEPLDAGSCPARRDDRTFPRHEFRRWGLAFFAWTDR